MATADWQNFGLVTGGASGALTGLLFVAVSINRDRIARHPGLRASAAQTLVLFTIPLIASILILTPAQSAGKLGWELVAYGIVATVVLVVVGRSRSAPGESSDSRLVRLLDRTSPNFVTMAFIEAAGASLVGGRGGGLYWIEPALAFALLGGIINAWLFLVAPLEPEESGPQQVLDDPAAEE